MSRMKHYCFFLLRHVGLQVDQKRRGLLLRLRETWKNQRGCITVQDVRALGILNGLIGRQSIKGSDSKVLLEDLKLRLCTSILMKECINRIPLRVKMYERGQVYFGTSKKNEV